MKRIKWGDNSKYDIWIKDNFDNFNPLSKMLEAFNQHFSVDITYSALISRCGRLHLCKQNNYYTEEQDKWIKAKISKYSIKDLTDNFNLEFNQNRSYESIKRHCYHHLHIVFGNKFLIGHETKYRNDVRVKLGNQHWVSKKRLVNNTIDPNQRVIVINPNEPITKDNTLIMSKKCWGYMLTKRFIKLPPQLKPLAFKTCKLEELLKGE